MGIKLATTSINVREWGGHVQLLLLETMIGYIFQLCHKTIALDILYIFSPMIIAIKSIVYCYIH